MAKLLSGIRDIVRQKLRDEFESGGEEFEWQDDELDVHIQDIVTEISGVSPYLVKETVSTTADSRELTISSIDDLLNGAHSITEAEYPTGNYPRSKRNIEVIDADTIELQLDSAPSAVANCYLYCEKVHQLTESSSTLTPQMENALVLGAVASAAVAKAQYHLKRVNVGGQRTGADLYNWGMGKMALYREALRRLAKAKTHTEYSKS